jgi:hypothetical protein
VRPYARDVVEEELADALSREDWTGVELWADRLDVLDPLPRRVPCVHAALWYAHVGLPVFPVQELGKKPYRGTRGLKDATTDPDTIRRWWEANPRANVAVATGHGVDVVDFDGWAGHSAWGQAFGDTWAGFDVLGSVSTPRPGGLHLWIKSTGSGNRAKMLPGVDYRGTGGYVLVPPSELDDRDDQHPGSYMFLRPPNVAALLPPTCTRCGAPIHPAALVGGHTTCPSCEPTEET